MANYTCDECGKVFPSVSELNKHLFEHLRLLKESERNKEKIQEQEKKQEVSVDTGLDTIKKELLKTLEIVTLTQAIKNMQQNKDTLKEFLEFQKVNEAITQKVLDEYQTEQPEQDNASQMLLNLLLSSQKQQNEPTTSNETPVSTEKKKQR